MTVKFDFEISIFGQDIRKNRRGSFFVAHPVYICLNSQGNKVERLSLKIKRFQLSVKRDLCLK